jgi:hypothetical protein
MAWERPTWSCRPVASPELHRLSHDHPDHITSNTITAIQVLDYATSIPDCLTSVATTRHTRPSHWSSLQLDIKPIKPTTRHEAYNSDTRPTTRHKAYNSTQSLQLGTRPTTRHKGLQLDTRPTTRHKGLQLGTKKAYNSTKAYNSAQRPTRSFFSNSSINSL